VQPCRRLQQLIEGEGVAADKPSRFQPDAAVGQPYLFYGCEVVGIETSGEQLDPVIELCRLGMGYPAFI
jgi:hypothetical protein